MTYLDLLYKWRNHPIMSKAIYKAYIRQAKRRQLAATESAS